MTWTNARIQNYGEKKYDIKREMTARGSYINVH